MSSLIPGMNARDMAKAMKRLGIQQQDIDAVEVVIKTKDKEYVFTQPQVAKVNMGGQESFQIIGTPEIRELSTEPEISDEDVETVVSQTGKSKEEALEVIKKHKGDLASAIMELSQ